MTDLNQKFERVIAEVAEEVKRLDSRGTEPSLPQYTHYDGLRVVEEFEETRQAESVHPQTHEAA